LTKEYIAAIRLKSLTSS